MPKIPVITGKLFWPKMKFASNKIEHFSILNFTVSAPFAPTANCHVFLMTDRRKIGSQQLKPRLKLRIIRASRYIATGTGPIRMEEFAAWFVNTFIGVGTKVVALGLQQVGWQTSAPVAIKKC